MQKQIRNNDKMNMYFSSLTVETCHKRYLEMTNSGLQNILII